MTVKRRFGWPAALLLLMASVLMLSAPVVALEAPDGPVFLEMLKSGKLKRLERHLQAYQGAFERAQISDRVVDDAFSIFETTDPEMAHVLGDWVEARPDSYAALVVRGYYYADLGWLTRGGREPGEVPADSMRAMNDFFTLAVRDLEAAIALKPELSIAHAALISIAMARGDSDRVAALQSAGLDAAPASWLIRWRYLETLSPGWSAAATTEAAIGNVAKYLALLEPVARRRGDLSSLLGFADYLSGQMLAQAGAHADAIGHFSRAVRFGQVWQYEIALGRGYSDNSQYVLAMRSFDSALALSPGRMEVQAARAWTYEAMASHDHAVAVWDELLVVRPMDPTILHAKARVLRGNGQYDEAKEAWDKAIFYGAHDAAIRAERGSLLLNELADEQASLEDLRVATALAPERAQYWLDYGIALTLMNQCDAVAALATYLDRCENGARPGDCGVDQRTWATSRLRRMESAQCEGG